MEAASGKPESTKSLAGTVLRPDHSVTVVAAAAAASVAAAAAEIDTIEAATGGVTVAEEAKRDGQGSKRKAGMQERAKR